MSLIPHDPNIEAAVLGAMLIETKAVITALEIITENDFVSDKNQIIFRVITEKCFQKKIEADILTVANELKLIKKYDYIGGAAALMALQDKCSSARNVRAYCQILKEKSALRQLIDAADAMLKAAKTETSSALEIADDALKKIFLVCQNLSRKGGWLGFTKISDLVVPMLQRLEEQSKLGKPCTGLSTGIADLDTITTGLHGGEMAVIAGRPAMGKTAFALNIAEHTAINKKQVVAIFSLEMTKESLFLRLLASQARVDALKLRSGMYLAAEWHKLQSAAEKIAEAPIYIDDDSGNTALDITIRAKNLAITLQQQEQQLALIMVDYIQFIRGSTAKNYENRQNEITEISRSLKALAKDLGVPVVVLSQLSRKPEERGKSGVPLLSDLRDSGAIEQDADLVALLYREEYYRQGQPELKGKAELIIAKQRNGPTGKIELVFESEYVKFRQRTPQDDARGPQYDDYDPDHY